MPIFLKIKIKKVMHIFFFCGDRGSNPKLCIFYALSLPTELSSRFKYESKCKRVVKEKIENSENKISSRFKYESKCKRVVKEKIENSENKSLRILSRSPSSTDKCRNYKVGRRDPSLNPRPHSCV
jgi:hypothetical protein